MLMESQVKQDRKDVYWYSWKQITKKQAGGCLFGPQEYLITFESTNLFSPSKDVLAVALK